MKTIISDPHKRFTLISALILVIGLGAAVYIYQTAGDDTYGALGYQIINGVAYPIMPQNAKMYRHDIEVFGGTAAVLADQLRRWFDGLWHGQSLAYTIACITVFISLVVFLTGRLLSAPKPEALSENDQAGSD
jgi:disulfide bond formation protein DsbB